MLYVIFLSVPSFIGASGRMKLNLDYICPYFRYSISVFIVPLIVLIFTYGAICRVIWQSAGGELGLRSPRLAPDSPPRCARSRRAPLISRAKINTVKQTVAVIAMYIACSTPFICAQLWATWDPDANESAFFNGKLNTPPTPPLSLTHITPPSLQFPEILLLNTFFLIKQNYKQRIIIYLYQIRKPVIF